MTASIAFLSIFAVRHDAIYVPRLTSAETVALVRQKVVAVCCCAFPPMEKLCGYEPSLMGLVLSLTVQLLVAIGPLRVITPRGADRPTGLYRGPELLEGLLYGACKHGLRQDSYNTA